MNATRTNARRASKRPKTQAKTRAARQTIQTLRPQEALQLLASALAYCQQAGLQVNAANEPNETLALFVPHARFVTTADGGAAFELAESAIAADTAE